MSAKMKQIALALLCAGACGSAGADRIVTSEGRTIEGIIEERREDPKLGKVVILRVGTSRITLQESRIATVETGTAAENAMVEARDLIRTRRGEEGIARMTAALNEGVPAEAVATTIVEQGDAIVEAAAQLGPEPRKQMLAILTAVENVEIPRRADLLGRTVQIYLALGEGDEAQRILKLLGPDFFVENPSMRLPTSRWLIEQIEANTDKKQYSTALTQLDLLEHVDPAQASARRAQFIVQWGADRRKDGAYEEALDIYVRYLSDELPAMAADRIAKALDEAEIQYRSTNDLPKAADLYERYGLLRVPEMAHERLVQLWRDQGWRYIRSGSFEEGRKALEKANEYVPGSAEKDLLRLEYEMRKQAIAPTDDIGHYELGLWALDNKLDEDALKEFERASRSDVLRENAHAYIAQIRNRQAETQLMEYLALYEKGQFTQVIEGLNGFMQEGHAAGYLEQAKELDDLAREALRLRHAERPQQAEALLQNAQRSFYAGRYGEAESLLKTIMQNYQDTIAYPRARNFYALVQDKLALARMESGKGGEPKTETSLTTDTATSGTTETRSEIDRVLENLRPGKELK